MNFRGSNFETSLTIAKPLRSTPSHGAASQVIAEATLNRSSLRWADWKMLSAPAPKVAQVVTQLAQLNWFNWKNWVHGPDGDQVMQRESNELISSIAMEHGSKILRS